MFLIQQAIGLEVQKRYQEIREVDDNLIAFYSGNFCKRKKLKYLKTPPWLVLRWD